MKIKLIPALSPFQKNYVTESTSHPSTFLKVISSFHPITSSFLGYSSPVPLRYYIYKILNPVLGYWPRTSPATTTIYLSSDYFSFLLPLEPFVLRTIVSLVYYKWAWILQLPVNCTSFYFLNSTCLMTKFKIISSSSKGAYLNHQMLIPENRTSKENYNYFDNHWASLRDAHIYAHI